MVSAKHTAGACVVLSSLAATYQVPPPGCRQCGLEAALLSDNLWQPPEDLSHVYAAGREGGLTQADAVTLLDAVRKVGHEKGAFMVTVTDGGMLDMAQNMIRSLDAVPCQAKRLVIGLGSNLCHKFQDMSRTTCVEVFQDAGSEDEVAWGSHEYWQVVFRKHVVLTMVAMSKASRHVVYTDPDIVFLGCPIAYLVGNYKDSHDIVFSPNNMLDPSAVSVEDVAETYATRGMNSILLGPHNRHADINTGLFLMRSTDMVADLMLKTMRIFKEQEFVHGHYQQYSLVKALDEVPALRVGVAGGDRLVNGNVFWGHRKLLKPAEVVSVHANWMQSKLKIPCLKQAGLWIDAGSSKRLSGEGWAEAQVASMDTRFATVENCGGGSSPPAPTKPGCYLWLPSGCRQHRFNAKDSWRWMEGLKDQSQCQNEAKLTYNKWCGTEDAQTLFVAPLATALVEPSAPGCYVWMPSGCEKRNFHAGAWRELPASEYTTESSCEEKAPDKYNLWCDKMDAQALWVPAPPDVPTAPGCYAWMPTGCKGHPLQGSSRAWIRDVWGEENAGARADRVSCEQKRKDQIEGWCRISNARMVLVTGS